MDCNQHPVTGSYVSSILNYPGNLRDLEQMVRSLLIQVSTAARLQDSLAAIREDPVSNAASRKLSAFLECVLSVDVINSERQSRLQALSSNALKLCALFGTYKKICLISLEEFEVLLACATDLAQRAEVLHTLYDGRLRKCTMQRRKTREEQDAWSEFQMGSFPNYKLNLYINQSVAQVK